jgi:lipoyl synthase
MNQVVLRREIAHARPYLSSAVAGAGAADCLEDGLLPDRGARRRRDRSQGASYDDPTRMNKIIPIVRVHSGAKFTSPQGTKAVKDGMRPGDSNRTSDCSPKPEWLRVRLPSGGHYKEVQDIVKEHRLNTVCAESKCPNIGECWTRGTATLMLMGSVCTRACRFCAVDTGNPAGWLDHGEPEAVANAVALMRLQYVVLTSVDRDDLHDGGAGHYAACIRAIHQRSPSTAVEALTPDFRGNRRALETLLDAGLTTFAQNLETVERLTHTVRDPRAGYRQSLDVLAHAKRYVPHVVTKTSLMVGLGETDQEIAVAMDDIRAANVDVLTLGQYMRPTLNHLPVRRFVTPEQFRAYRELGLSKGFREVVSDPLVRSSYRAEQVLSIEARSAEQASPSC